MDHKRWGPQVISCAIVLLMGIAPSELVGQSSPIPNGNRLLEVLVAPFGGLLVTAGHPDQAVGAHLIWPSKSALSLAARYEMRWTRDQLFYDAGSLDLQGLLIGDQNGGFFATAGWARWDRTDYGTVGLRAVWPFIPLAEGGSTAVQGWFDLRYASLDAAEAMSADGRVWAELMLVFVLWVRPRM